MVSVMLRIGPKTEMMYAEFRSPESNPNIMTNSLDIPHFFSLFLNLNAVIKITITMLFLK